MCDTCDQAAERVAAQYNGTIDAEEVRKIVRAFREESEAILEAEMTVGPEAERDNAAPSIPEMIEVVHGPASLVELYPLGMRPYVLIEAEPITGDRNENGEVQTVVYSTFGGGFNADGAHKALRMTLEQVEAQK